MKRLCPQSGAITGILKQMSDTMTASLNEATAAENESIQTYDELVASKTKEIDAFTASVERSQLHWLSGLRIL